MFSEPTPEYAEKLLSYLPARPQYYDWIRIISALVNTFGEQVALRLLLNKFGDEKPNETEKKIKNRLSNITFATLVYYAKQHGYKPERKAHTNTHKHTHGTNGINTYKTIDNNQKSANRLKRGNINSFNGTKKRTDTKTYDIANNTKDAIQWKPLYPEYTEYYRKNEPKNCKVINDVIHLDINHNSIYYPVCINKRIINKNIDADTGEVLQRYDLLNKSFKNASLSLQELIEHIRNGHPIIFGMFKPNENWYILNRKKESWGLSRLFAIDIDEGLTLQDAFEIEYTKQSLFIYTTASHTTKHHKFRIVFDSGRHFEDAELYSYMVSKFIKIYGADEQCKDVNRLFYGNTEAQIYRYNKQLNKYEKI